MSVIYTFILQKKQKINRYIKYILLTLQDHLFTDDTPLPFGVWLYTISMYVNTCVEPNDNRRNNSYI